MQIVLVILTMGKVVTGTQWAKAKDSAKCPPVLNAPTRLFIPKCQEYQPTNWLPIASFHVAFLLGLSMGIAMA